jgi:hypothetical protein
MVVHPAPHRRITARALCVVLILAVAGACSKSSEPSAPPPAGTPLATIGTTPTGSIGPSGTRAPLCTAEVLQPLADAQFPGITLADVTCSANAAIATLKGPGAPGGDGVGFFVVSSGAWTLAAHGAAADADNLRPPTVGTGLLATWRDKRAPAPAPAAKSGSGSANGDNTSSCHYEGDNRVCPTTTQPPPPTTTTTTRPTTTTTAAPPTTEAAPPQQ